MKNRRIRAGVLLLAFSGVISLFSWYHPIKPFFLPVPNVQKPLSARPASGKSRKFFSERKKRLKGLLPQNHPNYFYEWHKTIRTGTHEAAPSYPSNYKIKALLKARDFQSTRELSLISKIRPKQQFNWIERGPGNVSGRTRSLVVDPDDPRHNTWYAGSVGGGVWKTADAGKSWRELTAGLTNLATSTLAMAPSAHHILYAGTGEGFGNTDQIDGSGLWKSIDRGNSWTQLQSTADHPDFQNIMRIIVHPTRPEILLVATVPKSRFSDSIVRTSKILRSTNGGHTWQTVYETPDPVQHLLADPTRFNIQYATIHARGVIKSLDGGISWQDASRGISRDVRRMEMAIAPSRPSRLYLSAEMASKYSGLYVSDDAGSTWALAEDAGSYNTALEDIRANWLGGPWGSQGWYDNAIAVHPFNANIVFAGGISLMRLDLTETDETPKFRWKVIADVYWEYQGDGKGVHPDQHQIVLIPTVRQSFRMLVANDGGVTYSDDEGETFTNTTNGYNTAQFYGVDKMNGANRYVGGTQDNGSWVSPLNPKPNSRWNFAPSGDGFESAWNHRDPNLMLESSQFNFIYRSNDGGENWYPVWGIEQGPGQAPFFTRIAKSKKKPDRVFVVGKSGVFKSEDFGETWQKTLMTDKPGWFRAAVVRMSLSDPDIVWAGTFLSQRFPLYLSTDAGNTFMPVIYTGKEIGPFTGLTTHPTDPNTAYVLFSVAQSPKILRTRDLGKTWEDISGFGDGVVSRNGFPDVAVYSLAALPHAPGVLWAGTEIGIFESLNDGKSWHYADNGLPPLSIFDMTIVNEQLVLATHGRGIWTLDLQDIDLSKLPEPAPEVPEIFQLAQNYPNPFNSLTRIQYQLANPGRVLLSIFNPLGQHVRTLVDDHRHSGTVVWDGKNQSGAPVSSGLYIYRLQTEEGVREKKMLLLK